MTRSDLVLEVHRVLDNQKVPGDAKNLISAMHRKIEGAYSFLFALEGYNQTGNADTHVALAAKLLAEELRKKLES